MRTDMYKVIVERPRKWKGADADANRRRQDFEGPQFLGMRAGHGRPALNENLNPLRRYLRAQVGRPWNKVYGEISANIDRRNTVQLHIFAHLDDLIAIQVERRDGHWVDLKRPIVSYRSGKVEIRQELYVDPRTGLIRPNKDHDRPGREWRARQKAEHDEAASQRHRISDEMVFLKHCGEWYEVRVATLPPVSQVHRVFDAVRKRMVSTRDRYCDEAFDLYGRWDQYAVSKRQLSRREIESQKLPR